MGGSLGHCDEKTQNLINDETTTPTTTMEFRDTR